MAIVRIAADELQQSLTKEQIEKLKVLRQANPLKTDFYSFKVQAPAYS